MYQKKRGRNAPPFINYRAASSGELNPKGLNMRLFPMQMETLLDFGFGAKIGNRFLYRLLLQVLLNLRLQRFK